MLATGTTVTTAGLTQVDREKIYQWINELSSPETRENALLELSKKRESVADLAPMLWHSCGYPPAKGQGKMDGKKYYKETEPFGERWDKSCGEAFKQIIYCLTHAPVLAFADPSLPYVLHVDASMSGLGAVLNQEYPDGLQPVAFASRKLSASEQRYPIYQLEFLALNSAFLAAHIPLFLYPFLHTVSKTRPFEYLRLTSLGVIGALVKTDEQEVINFLLTTEIIPLCLRIMESGSELSKTGKMVLQLSKEPSARLLKHVVRCYLRLSDNSRAREALRQCLPDQLKDTTFAQVLKDDSTTKRWLAQLVKNLQEGQVTDPRGIPLPTQ
ncbi:cell differentiation RCD1-like protein [Labeo rohita]|uniref:CCR4-NOT transcription complex subunit 9 n=2 Tax=Labeo rohita TaxID=84645 RepID=A0A498NE34_LABRO|nr:cell differentiation RCD1-like protein [Labeo rohita]